jgi:nicotinamidase-related amidase
LTGKSILLVMDMINDLVSEEGPAAKSFAPEVKRRDVVANIARALSRARSAGVPVGYVRVGFSPDYRECPDHSPQFSAAKANGLYKLGSWGTEVYRDLSPEPQDFDIVKHRVSPFYGTRLEPILGAHGIRRLFLTGVSTTYVVEAAAREAHDRDYQVVVLEDCCAALSQEEHDWSIRALSRPAAVTTSAEVDFTG